ncbi:MAG: hypothetical protein M3O30_16405 [Planctomycetota bacterium]|nr:hypothetical protein [Planctomycetota bacterium]
MRHKSNSAPSIGCAFEQLENRQLMSFVMTPLQRVVPEPAPVSPPHYRFVSFGPDPSRDPLGDTGHFVLNQNGASLLATLPPGALSSGDAERVWIHWGDGTQSMGQLATEPSGIIDITGSHSYALPGLYSTRIVVFQKQGSWGHQPFNRVENIAGFASVSDPNLPSLSADETFAWTLNDKDAQAGFGRFDFPRPPADQEFRAIVDWGDGQTSSVTVGQLGAPFSISGTHHYPTIAKYQVHVHVFTALKSQSSNPNPPVITEVTKFVTIVDLTTELQAVPG